MNSQSAKGRTDLADRTTPLIRNEWYVAAMSDEVTRTPFRRVILNEDIVLYRQLDGTAVALQNRCAHRSYPLSEGVLNGDRIVCGYHGFEYGPDGRCARIPSLDRPPSSVRVDSYPVIEQGPFIWVWIGNGPARVDRFVEQPWFTNSGWKAVSGYFYMKANYLGLHENLMDLTHFPFLHGAAIGKPEHARAALEVTVSEEAVQGLVVHADAPIPPTLVAAADLVEPVQRRVEQKIASPALHIASTINTDSAVPPRIFHRQIVHCMTPETADSTHYFWATVRDIAIDDTEVDREFGEIASTAFLEDAVALERIDALIARDVRPEFRERIIASDGPAIAVLRWLATRAAASAG